MSKRIIAVMLAVTGMVCSNINVRAEAMVSNVPAISQNPQLPTGCEATALTMLLNWGGIEVSKGEVANAIPWGYIPDTPREVFIGNPYSKRGLGVYSQPIFDTLKAYNNGKGLNLTGYELTDVLEYLDYDIPVMVWCTINMKKPVYRSKWIDRSGNLFEFPTYEHAVVIVGYDENHIYVNDPGKGKRVAYDKKEFTQRYDELGKQAVTFGLPKLEIGDSATQYPVRLFGNGRVMIPAWGFCDLSGYMVQQNEGGMVSISGHGRKIADFSLGDTFAEVNEQVLTELLPAQIIDDVLYIDIEVSKALGAQNIQYDTENKTVKMDIVKEIEPNKYMVMLNGKQLQTCGYEQDGIILVPLHEVCNGLMSIK